MSKSETVYTDVLIIGGGPAGLATAIHLADLFKQKSLARRILLVEKGSAIGSHILSGAIIKPDVFNRLLPDTPVKEVAFDALVSSDLTVFLTENKSYALPFHLPYMSNAGNYTASLGQVCRFLADKAERRGVEIYTGFSVSEILYRDGKVAGAKTIDTGVDQHGNPLENYQPGTPIDARLTIFAEGTRGPLAKRLIEKFELDKGKNAQMYSLACKELWSVPEGNIRPGEVYHTMGYPLSHREFGGGFIYGLNNNKVAVGLVVGLDYEDPTFDTHDAFSVWKTTPFVSKFLKGGKLLEYGAKTLPEGGYYSVPKLFTDNALLVGDSAGLVAMPALKGVHLAIASGMAAAKAAAEAFARNNFTESALSLYETEMTESVFRELYPVRNFRQGFSKGMFKGAIHFGAQLITGGAGFAGRLRSKPDRLATKTLSGFKGKPFRERFKKKLEFDKVLTFDKATDVFYSGVHHDEHQVVHVRINNPESFKNINIKQYGAPEQFFCSSEVYELHTDKNGNQELRIHAENCMHCRTCDIKSPGDGITWSVPNGGNGPEFQYM
jgi:electron-transferring-flavoprotein dehydrogenase